MAAENMHTMNKQPCRSQARQMELNLPHPIHMRANAPRRRRLPGAHWWFQQMRLAVSNATPWTPPASAPMQGDSLPATTAQGFPPPS